MIAPFPAAALLDQRLVRKKRRSEHPSSWVRSLSLELGKQNEFAVRIFSLSRAVRRHHVASIGSVEIEFIPKLLPERLDWYHLQLLNALQIYPYIKRYHPDIVHAFGLETGNGVILSWLPFTRSCFIQGIIEKLAPYVDQPAFKQRIRMALERRAVPRMNALIAETEFARQWAIMRGAKNVALIPHAVNWEFIEAEPSSVTSAVVLAIGSLVYNKGFDVIIKGFSHANVKGSSLVIIGGGPEHSRLKQLAKELGVGNRTQFKGVLSRKEVIAEMQNASMLCIASRMDTSPNVVTEAHALGLPVIGTLAGGIPDMVENNGDGLLVLINDYKGMGRAMKSLLNNRARAKSMGSAGRSKVLQINNPEYIADLHVQYFRRLARQAQGE